MTFSEVLNEYIRVLGCTPADLARASGLTTSVISRYRSGQRVPAVRSNQLYRLSAGIVSLSRQQGLAPDQDEVLRRLCAPLPDAAPAAAAFSAHFSRLMEGLGIVNDRMARHLNYSPAAVSHFRTGKRRPSDFVAFVDGVHSYILKNCDPDQALPVLAGLMGCSTQDIRDPQALRGALLAWLNDGAFQQPREVQHFLETLDSFDLRQFIAALRFGDPPPQPPAAPVLPKSRFCYTLEGMRQAELEFFAITARSAADGRVFMCSDMQMDDMAQDTEFGKQWMMGLALTMKRGLHIDIVHSLNRPIEELMLGLESWIPLYMTGQVTPYYLPGVHNKVYCHLNYCSDAVALSGECIEGSHAQGRYHLTTDPEDLTYYQKKAVALLKKALPLMEIYREERSSAFAQFYRTKFCAADRLQNILCAPPIATITPELLRELLAQNGVAGEEAQRLLQFAEEERAALERLLSAQGSRSDEMPCLSREEFEACPPRLPLAAAFPQRAIPYTWEAYQQHMALTAKFAAAHPGYDLHITEHGFLRNVQIHICPGKWAMVSKEHSPAIHFVIYNPALRGALEKLSIPVWESPARKTAENTQPSAG